MSSDSPRYSIVVPVYLSEGSLPGVIARGDDLAGRLDAPLELVFVVDGSPDGSRILLRRLLSDDHAFSAQLISLSRNFGAFSAIRTGLAAAKGEFVTVMAADLQEPIELYESIFAALATREHDVAIGVRASRDDPWSTKASSSLYLRLYRRFVQREMPEAGVDIFGCTREVASRLVSLEESHTSLVGLLFWVGFRRVEIPYVRQARTEGKSSWSLRRRLRYLLDSVFSFTDLPVLLITTVGVVGVVLSVLVAIGVFVAWAAGKINVAGYTPLMLAIVFTASSVLFGLGIIGSYVWRTYENTKRRPTAIPMSHEHFEPS